MYLIPTQPSFPSSLLRNLSIDSYEKDFSFYVNKEEFKTPRFVADILSPIVSKLHLVDQTINSFRISLDKDLFLREKEMISNIFTKLVQNHSLQPLLLIQNENDNETENEKENEKIFNGSKIDLLLEIFQKIGNEEFTKILTDDKMTKIFSNISNQNVFERLKEKKKLVSNKNDSSSINCDIKDKNYAFYIDEEIDYIALHMYELERQPLLDLDLNILSLILANPNLCIESETWLLEFIIDLTKKDESYSTLYEFLEFSDMNSDDIELFIKSFELTNINYGIWRLICNQLYNTSKKSSSLSSSSSSNSLSSQCCQIPIYNSSSNSNFCILPNSSLNSASRRCRTYLKRDSSISSENTDNNNVTNNLLPNYGNYELVQKIEFTEERGQNLNGIIRHLTETVGEHRNLMEKGIIDITSSSATIGELSRIVDLDTVEYSYTANEENSWISLDFKNMNIIPTHYTIRTENNAENYDHLQNWVVEGSTDGEDWVVLDRRENNGVLNRQSALATFEMNGGANGDNRVINNDNLNENLNNNENALRNDAGNDIGNNRSTAHFKCIRIRQTGLNWGSRNYLSMACIEFFGDILKQI